MSYTELIADDPTVEALNEFWGRLSHEGILSVHVDVDRETAGVTATSTLWSKSGRGPIGVRLGLLNVATRWREIAEASATDEDWTSATGKEAMVIVRIVESARPDEIEATYTLDGHPADEQ